MLALTVVALLAMVRFGIGSRTHLMRWTPVVEAVIWLIGVAVQVGGGLSRTAGRWPVLANRWILRPWNRGCWPIGLRGARTDRLGPIGHS
jgi:hypothetical protein